MGRMKDIGGVMERNLETMAYLAKGRYTWEWWRLFLASLPFIREILYMLSIAEGVTGAVANFRDGREHTYEPLRKI